MGSADRYLGLLCATLGQPEAAARHLERAIEQNRRLAAGLPLAYSLFDYGRLVFAPAPRAARESLREAEQLARARGLVQLSQRITKLGIL